MATDDIKKQDLAKVPKIIDTSNINMIVERNGQICKVPFRGERVINEIYSNDLIMIQNKSNPDTNNKIVSVKYEDLMAPLLDSDNIPVYIERISDGVTDSIIPMVKGTIELDGSLNNQSSTGIRSRIYIPIVFNEKYNFSCPDGLLSTIRIFLCDSSKRIIKDKWNDGYLNYINLPINTTFTNPLSKAKYMIFDINYLSDDSIEIHLDKVLPPNKEHAIFNNIRLQSDYNIKIAPVIGDDYSYETVLEHESSTDDSTTFTIKAPSSSPAYSRLRLLNSGAGGNQIVDLTSKLINKSTGTDRMFEIGIRGNKNDIPDFAIGFSNGVSEDIKNKLVVDHDAIPVRFTHDGILFGRHENDLDPQLVNIINLKGTVDRIYDTLVAYSMISGTSQTDVSPRSMKAMDISYNNESFEDVKSALDYALEIIQNTDMESINTRLNELEKDIVSVDAYINITEGGLLYNLNEMNSKVNHLDETLASVMSSIDELKADIDSLRNERR